MPPALTSASFVALLGNFPKPPTAVEILGAHEHDGPTRTLVQCTAEDDEPIRAFLLFESRSLASSRLSETFAGFRVFTEGGLERTEELYKGAMANRLLLEGRSALGQELVELRRALDVLSARPEVDARCLGAIGHSAGGPLAALLMYVDPRVKAGCASCGAFLFRWWFNQAYLRPINGFAGLWTVPGLLRWGDVDDILAGLAPRPYLETGDPEETAGHTAALTGKARARYAALGVQERFSWVTYASGHTFRRDMRERSYAWFDRWLRDSASS